VAAQASFFLFGVFMMSHSHIDFDAAVYAAYSQASTQLFYPKGTVRCSGDALFRKRAARDLGCILDVTLS
jgi:hypothetical protein